MHRACNLIQNIGDSVPLRLLRILNPDPPEMITVCPYCGCHPFSLEYLQAHPKLARRLGYIALEIKSDNPVYLRRQ